MCASSPRSANKSLILYIRLHVPPAGPETALEGKSWLLVSATKIKDLEIYGFADPSKMKAPNLGRVFSDILPRNGNEFTLELGVLLPDLFPNMDGKPDFIADVLKDGERHPICVSNRMAKLRFSTGNEQWHVIVPRSTLPDEKTPSAGVGSASEQSPATAAAVDEKMRAMREAFGIPAEGVHTEMLRTMVTARFPIRGADAEEALSADVSSCLSEFIDLLNRFVVSNLMVESDQPAITTPIYDTNTFDSIYFMVQGQDPEKIGIGRLGLNLAKLQLNSGSHAAEQSAKVRSYLDGTLRVDEARRFLASARSFMDGGVLQSALLHLAIAAEMATTRFVHKKLVEAGVSKNKLDEAGEQLTFSKMLNIDLFVVCPQDKKPDRQLVGKINEIRTMRNGLMHEGRFGADGAKVRELYFAAKAFLKFLEERDAEVVPGQTGNGVSAEA